MVPMHQTNGVWPRRWRPGYLWGLVAVAFFFRGDELYKDLRPPVIGPRDFFQEWASARNVVEGLPAYTPQDVTVTRYLGLPPPSPNNRWFIHYNAHPPVAVLLALP